MIGGTSNIGVGIEGDVIHRGELILRLGFGFFRKPILLAEGKEEFVFDGLDHLDKSIAGFIGDEPFDVFSFHYVVEVVLDDVRFQVLESILLVVFVFVDVPKRGQ